MCPVAAMVTEKDIYISAKLLIDQHGEDAAAHAAMRADELQDQGDRKGAHVMLRVIRAISVIEMEEAPGTVH